MKKYCQSYGSIKYNKNQDKLAKGLVYCYMAFVIFCAGYVSFAVYAGETAKLFN